MRVGILGGGQLSRMLALAGYPLGLSFVFYEPNKTCSAMGLGPIIHASYTDQAALAEFANSVDVITYENENIPIETLTWLGAQKRLYPGVAILEVSRDRLLEKQVFERFNIPTNGYLAVHNKQDVETAIEKFGYPLILKTRKEGYDGKGQFKIDNEKAWETMQTSLRFQNLIAEEYVAFDREVSIVAVKSKMGDIQFYDLNENVHQKGILIRTMNKPNDPMWALAKSHVTTLLNFVAYVGVLAIEFFQVGDRLLVNEMAPRVHNSGHWTIEGAATSQFENHLRAIVGWPLGDTRSVGLAVMHNIIGEMPDKTTLLQASGLHLHDYAKTPMPGRKLGHTTVIKSFR